MYRSYSEFRAAYDDVAERYEELSSKMDWLAQPDPERAFALYRNAASPSVGFLLSGRTNITRLDDPVEGPAIDPDALFNFGATNDGMVPFAEGKSPRDIYERANGDFRPRQRNPLPHTEDRTGGVLHYDRGWHFLYNDAWVLGGIHGRIEFILASPRTRKNIYDEESGHLTITGRELLGLHFFGYEFREVFGQGLAVCARREVADAANLSQYLTAIEDGGWEALIDPALVSDDQRPPAGLVAPLRRLAHDSGMLTKAAFPMPIPEPEGLGGLRKLRAGLEEAAARDGIDLATFGDSIDLGLATMLALIPQDQQPTVTSQEAPSAHHPRLRVRGSTPLPQLPEATVELGIFAADDDVPCQLGMSLPPEASWGVFDRISIGNLALLANLKTDRVQAIHVSGTFELDGGGIDVEFALPLGQVPSEWTFRFQPARENPLTPSAVGKLLGLSADDVVPIVLDNANVTALSLRFRDGMPQDVVLVVEAAPKFDLGPLTIERCSARTVVLDAPDTRVVSVDLALVLALGETRLLLAGRADAGGLTLSGLTRGSLRQLVRDLVGADLPEEVPDIEFERLGISVTDEGEFTIEAEVTGTWPIPWLGRHAAVTGGRLEIRRVRRRGGAHEIDILLAVDATGVQVADGVQVESLHLEVRHREQEWTFGGSAEVTVMDHEHPIRLEGGTEMEDGGAWLSFRAEDLGLTVMHVEDARLELDRAELRVRLRTESGQSRGLKLGGRATLEWGKMAPLSGSLRLSHGDEADGVYLEIDGDVRILVPVPEALDCSPELILKGGGLGIERRARGWSFRGSTALEVRGMPPAIQARLGAIVAADLSIEPGSFSLKSSLKTPGSDTADDHPRPLAFEYELPELDRGRDPTPLGNLGVEGRALVVSASGTQISVQVTLGLQLPQALNLVFGMSDRGEAVRDVFVTETPVGIRLTVGIPDGRPGCSIDLVDSPVRQVTLEDGWWPVDLGQAGSLELEAPRFRLSGREFRAGGGIRQEIRIPMPLIREILRGRLSQDALDTLPSEPVPLSEIRVFDRESDTFDAVAFRDFVRNLGIHLGDRLDSALDELAKVGHRLPDRLKDYLASGLPSEFSFDIAAGTAGGLTFEARAGTRVAPESLYVLLPAGPQLLGIEVGRVSFGPVLGGALFRLDLDVIVDRFDILEILAAAALGDGIPTLNQAHSTFVSKGMTALIVYESGIPIPIPLFFEELGVDQVGPLGGSIRSSWTLKPSIDLAGLFTAVPEFWQFLGDDDVRLPPDGAVDVELRLNESFIELPPMFGTGGGPHGGHLLGQVGSPVFEAHLWRTFASVLNGIKFFSPYEFLTAIPLDHRVGRVPLDFGPLSGEFLWVVATRRELIDGFRAAGDSSDGGYTGTDAKAVQEVVRLAREERERWSEALPSPPGSGSAGPIVMLSGALIVSKSMAFETFVGLEVVRGGDLAAGLRAHSRIGGLLELELECFLASTASKDGSDFEFIWDALLAIGDRVGIAGGLKFRETGGVLSLEVSGREPGSSARMSLGKLGELALDDFEVSTAGSFKLAGAAPEGLGNQYLGLTAAEFSVEGSGQSFALHLKAPRISVGGGTPISGIPDIDIPRTDLDFSMELKMEIELAPGWRISGATFHLEMAHDGITLSGKELGGARLHLGGFTTPQSPFVVKRFLACTRQETVEALAEGSLNIAGVSLGHARWTLRWVSDDARPICRVSGKGTVDLDFVSVELGGSLKSDGSFSFRGQRRLHVAAPWPSQAEYTATLTAKLGIEGLAMSARIRLVGLIGNVLYDGTCGVESDGHVEVAGFRFKLGDPLSWW
ncbi:MAG: hypothetical protein EA351_00440 [Gemmatimonadales bacterium]|nr:MAG: hypothetical protein EA351_00440 [Gemmatimonadales bacterium]